MKAVFVLCSLALFVSGVGAAAQTCVSRELKITNFSEKKGKRTEKTPRIPFEKHFDSPTMRVQVTSASHTFQKTGEQEVTVNKSSKIFARGLGMFSYQTLLDAPQGVAPARHNEPAKATGLKKNIAGIPCEEYRQVVDWKTPHLGSAIYTDTRCISFKEPAGYFVKYPIKKKDGEVFPAGLPLERHYSVRAINGEVVGEEGFLVTTVKVAQECPPAEYTSIPAGFKEFKLPAQ